MSKNEPRFDGVLAEAANLAADRLVEFLSANRGVGEESWQRMLDQAKVACVAVASKVRYEAALNNRKAMELTERRLLRDQRDAA